MRWLGCARAACMPGASSRLEVQRSYFANFLARIRDLPSIPAYRFWHAKGFSPERIPDKTVVQTLWIIGAVNKKMSAALALRLAPPTCWKFYTAFTRQGLGQRERRIVRQCKIAIGRFHDEHCCRPQISSGLGVTEITSDPDGAEIFLDDKLIGTTPATLRLTEGTHTLILKSPHHPYWQRSITVLKDSTITVKATLDPI